jgi:lysine 6-dehydrogenase
MSFSYMVLGAGRQGLAAAYDLAKFGDAARVTLADVDAALAKESANKVNQLLGRNVAEAIALDVRDKAAVRRAFAGYDVVLSAVPYFFNLGLTRIAIESGVSFCDLGGNTDIVLEQHALHDEACRAGVRVVPDCGMGPGMGNTLAVHAMSLLDHAEHVYICDGGLPQHPTPPWNYQLTFNIEGLTNEYYGGMTVLRGGKLTHIPCFTELEMVEVPPLGELECFFIAGGASTAPWTFEGKLQTYELKVLRYPGNFAQLKAFSDLGLFEIAPVEVDGAEVIPRHVFHALFEPQVQAEVIKDVCIVRARAVGTKDGAPAETAAEIIDYYDEATGFSAMQRLTGWHFSIVAAMMARGETPVGALPLELAVPGDAFVREARKRGLHITESIAESAGAELVASFAG